MVIMPGNGQLKPANILVTDHGGEPHPFVLDFGIAVTEECGAISEG